MATREQRRRERQRKHRAQKQDRARAREIQSAAHPETITWSPPGGKLGPPGIPTEIHVVPQFTEARSEADDRARLNDEREREFQVFAHLSVALSLSQRDVRMSLDPMVGSSLLLAAPNAVGMILHTPWGGVTLHKNEAGEISAIEFKCRAHSRQEALEVYSERVAPFLDHMSYQLDVPLHVASIGWFDDLHKISGAHFTVPYGQVPAAGLTGSFDPSLRPFLALYREAISNPSVFYQFLCFCKILEGTFRVTLRHIFKRAEERGISLVRSTPAVPQLDPLASADQARAFEGRSIQEAYDSYLQPEFRNALAHFAAKGREPLRVSSYVTGARVEGAVQLARVCARLAIGMLEGYLAQLPS
jgi:methylamine utilization protein MauJ